MVSGGGAFGRAGEACTDGLPALMKDPTELPHSFPHVRLTRKGYEPGRGADSESACALAVGSPALRTSRNKFLLLVATQAIVSCYSSLNGLRQ